jgi:hypothetical protein
MDLFTATWKTAVDLVQQSPADFLRQQVNAPADNPKKL